MEEDVKMLRQILDNLLAFIAGTWYGQLGLRGSAGQTLNCGFKTEFKHVDDSNICESYYRKNHEDITKEIGMYITILTNHKFSQMPTGLSSAVCTFIR
jgi:hypothetical protein